MMVLDSTTRASARRPLHALRLLAALSLGGSTLLGCGSDFSTGVPPSTVLDEADDEELQDICLAVSAEFVDIVEGPTTSLFCTIGGLIAEATGAGECAETRNACIADAPPPDVMSDCSGINMAAFDACDTTVGEAEQCIRDLRSNIEALNRTITCNTDPETAPEVDFEDLLPPECQAAATECPALAMLLDLDAP